MALPSLQHSGEAAVCFTKWAVTLAVISKLLPPRACWHSDRVGHHFPATLHPQSWCCPRPWQASSPQPGWHWRSRPVDLQFANAVSQLSRTSHSQAHRRPPPSPCSQEPQQAATKLALQPCQGRLIPAPAPAACWKWVFNLCRRAVVPPARQQQPRLAATRIEAGKKRWSCCPAVATGRSCRETWPGEAAKAIKLPQHTKQTLLLLFFTPHLGASCGAHENGSQVQSLSTTLPLLTATGSVLHTRPALPTVRATCQKDEGAAGMV